jgi:hypothetical protein
VRPEINNLCATAPDGSNFRGETSAPGELAGLHFENACRIPYECQAVC